MIHKFTFDGQDLILTRSKIYNQVPRRSLTMKSHYFARNLFSKDIMHVFALFKLAYDKSDSYELDLVKNWNGKVSMMKSYFHFHYDWRG